MREGTRYEKVEERAGGYRHVKLKSGRLISFYDAQQAAERAYTDMVRGVSRMFKLANRTDPEFEEYDLERIEWFVADLEGWISAVRGELERRHGVKTQEERIALLRNTTGRTSAEAEAFKRKADELEGRLT